MEAALCAIGLSGVHSHQLGSHKVQRRGVHQGKHGLDRYAEYHRQPVTTRKYIISGEGSEEAALAAVRSHAARSASITARLEAEGLHEWAYLRCCCCWSCCCPMSGAAGPAAAITALCFACAALTPCCCLAVKLSMLYLSRLSCTSDATLCAEGLQAYSGYTLGANSCDKVSATGREVMYIGQPARAAFMPCEEVPVSGCPRILSQ